ncbi:hypothetical protein ACWJKU_01350 [Methylocaldum sp. MU1018]
MFFTTSIRFEMVTGVLALLAPVAVVLIAILLVFVPITDANTREMLMMLVGALVVMAKDVYGFEFGSSRGSRDKDLRRREDEHGR